MAAPKTRTQDDRNGFDVTCVVGHVNYSQDGIFDPYVAALILLGEHGADGVYQFPAANGGTHTVTVETTEGRTE